MRRIGHGRRWRGFRRDDKGFALVEFAMALPVMRHRIATNFTAASEGVTTDVVVKRMLDETPSREGELEKDERFKKIFAK